MIWQGVPLGFDGPDINRDDPIDYSARDDGNGNAPTLVVGPPGSNKTVGLVAAQLLDDDGSGGPRSYVVFDPKGELCAITSKYRRRVSDVKIINPYGLLTDERPDMKSDKWNPFNDLDTAALGYGDDCQAKGDALIKASSNQSQPFFSDTSRSGVTGTIMHLVEKADAQKMPRSLPAVRATLTLPPDQLRTIIQEMVDSGDEDISPRMAKFLADNREVESVKSTIEADSAWLTKPMRDDMVTAGGVDFRDCTKRAMTIYVIIPVKELKSKGTYARLMWSAALRALYVENGIPTTLIVEEAFVLGYHEELEQAASILRGFGSRMTIVFQSYQQIKKLYPETHGLFTSGAVLSFRPSNLEDAKWLVEKAGKEFVPVLSAADPSSPSDFGVRPSWNQQQRERIPLHKMAGMPKGRALVWLPHDEAPRMSYVRGYFEIPKLNARASANPYHKSGRAAAAGSRYGSGFWRELKNGFDAGRERLLDL